MTDDNTNTTLKQTIQQLAQANKASDLYRKGTTSTFWGLNNPLKGGKTLLTQIGTRLAVFFRTTQAETQNMHGINSPQGEAMVTKARELYKSAKNQPGEAAENDPGMAPAQIALEVKECKTLQRELYDKVSEQLNTNTTNPLTILTICPSWQKKATCSLAYLTRFIAGVLSVGTLNNPFEAKGYANIALHISAPPSSTPTRPKTTIARFFNFVRQAVSRQGPSPTAYKRYPQLDAVNPASYEPSNQTPSTDAQPKQGQGQGPEPEPGPRPGPGPGNTPPGS